MLTDPDPAAVAVAGSREPPLGPWHSHRPRWLPLLRALLLTVVGLTALMWLFFTPRQGSPGEFVDDLRRDEVRSYQLRDSEDVTPFAGPTFYSGSHEGRLVVWCTGRLDCHRVGWAELVAVEGVGFETQGEERAVRQIVEQYSPEVRPSLVRTDPWLSSLSVVWPIAWLIMLFVLITGPQPRLATKWAAFWIMLLPGGLGLIWLLTNEAPWSRRVASLPEPAPGPAAHRWTGGWTFLAVALLSTLLTAMPDLLATALL